MLSDTGNYRTQMRCLRIINPRIAHEANLAQATICSYLKKAIYGGIEN